MRLGEDLARTARSGEIVVDMARTLMRRREVLAKMTRLFGRGSNETKTTLPQHEPGDSR